MSPARWTAATAPQRSKPVSAASRALKTPPLGQQALEGEPLDEFHCEANRTVVFVDAEHADDVGVIDTREQPRLLHDGRRLLGLPAPCAAA
jgi:hypothetical protein